MVSSEYPYRSNNQKCRRETKLIEEKWLGKIEWLRLEKRHKIEIYIDHQLHNWNFSCDDRINSEALSLILSKICYDQNEDTKAIAGK